MYNSVHILDDQPKNREKWTDYVHRHPDACLDHCWEWRWVLERSFGYHPYYIGAFESDRLIGILPLFHVPRGFGRSDLVSIPFGNYGGICADSPHAVSLLINEAKRLMKSLNCSFVTLNNRTPVDSAELQSLNEKARYSMQIDNSIPQEKIFSSLKETVRRRVRYCRKHGVIIDSSRDTGPLYEIHLHKFRLLGTPCFPRAYFDLTLEHFGKRAIIHYAYYENKPIAFKFCLFFHQSMITIVGGDLEQYVYLNPNYLLFWHGIQTVVTNGLSELDMGRSSRNSGPAQHKMFLGMKELPLGYQYLLSDKHKFSPRSAKNSRFQLASRIWRRIPINCTKILGPRIVRYFA